MAVSEFDRGVEAALDEVLWHGGQGVPGIDPDVLLGVIADARDCLRHCAELDRLRLVEQAEQAK